MAEAIFLGEHKTHIESVKGLYEWLEKADEIRRRAELGVPQYQDFKGKKIALGYMAEHISPKVEDKFLSAARANGIAMLGVNGRRMSIVRSAVKPSSGAFHFR